MKAFPPIAVMSISSIEVDCNATSSALRVGSSIARWKTGKIFSCFSGVVTGGTQETTDKIGSPRTARDKLIFFSWPIVAKEKIKCGSPVIDVVIITVRDVQITKNG